MSGPLPLGSDPAGLRRSRGLGGLSGKLMLLTLGFVMLAEVLIFAPAIATFRNNWLRDRLAAAHTAALVLEAAPTEALPEALVARLLDDVGARSIAIKIGGVRRLLASSDAPTDDAWLIDMRSDSAVDAVIASLDTLLNGGDRLLRVIGPAPMGGEFIESVMSERPLRDAMRRHAANLLGLSILISGITGALVFAALHWLIVRPVKVLADSIASFGLDASDARRILTPSGRADELGDAERSLAAMQQALSQQFKQQQRLAALGLAVAKVNHDLRNLLSSAHLLSDRLASVADPTVQRIAPKLVAALDRAAAFCQATLTFGKAEERAPAPRKFDLNTLLNDLRDLLGLGEDTPVKFQTSLPAPMMLRADPDQLLRVLLNLTRNGMEAMGGKGVLSISARRLPGRVEIEVADEGPGVPQELRARLFQAFSGSARPGSVGLGLAISAELMRAQGGAITLVDSARGACFRLTLPT